MLLFIDFTEEYENSQLNQLLIIKFIGSFLHLWSESSEQNG